MVATVAKIFRAHCPRGGPATITFLQADPEQIIEKLEPVIKDLVMLKEVQKTTKFLSQCAQMAFPRMLPAECKVFSERLLAACEHVVVKRKSATTGKKTPPAVYRIILAMNASDVSSQPVVPPLPTYATPPRQVLQKLGSSQTVSSCPSSKSMAPKTSAAASSKEAIASAASVANFYDDMLGAVEGGEEENEASESVHGRTSQNLSTTDMALVMISNGQKLVAKMKPGNSWFCIATFDSETEYQTELPNSTFLKYQESVGKASVQKKHQCLPKKGLQHFCQLLQVQKLLLQVLCTCKPTPRNTRLCFTDNIMPGP